MSNATGHDLRSAVRKLVRSTVKITNTEGLSDAHVEHREDRHAENVERVMTLIDEVTDVSPDTRENLTPVLRGITDGLSAYPSAYARKNPYQ